MLEFREHYVGSQHVVDVYIIPEHVPPIRAGDLRKVLDGPYWLESTDVCYEMEELVAIVNKLKELNGA